MTTNTDPASRRLRIDSFRFYAIFLIVAGHAGMYVYSYPANFLAKVGYIFYGLGVRYAIPFFFILAGYFIGSKIFKEPDKAFVIAGKYTARLASVLLFWWLVYVLAQPQEFLKLLQEEPITLLFEGSKYHLWFLVSLILTVWFFVLWPTHKSFKSFLYLGGVLYLVGLLAGAYKVTPFGFDMHFNTRNGVFFSTLFFAVGVMFSNRLPRISRRMALGIALGGLALSIGEAYYLRRVYELTAEYVDYLIGTVPFGVGMSLLCITQSDTRLDKLVGPFGKYTLGIYACHVLFIDLLEPITSLIYPSSLQMIWRGAFPILVFILSFLTSVALAFVIEKTPLRGIMQKLKSTPTEAYQN